MWGDAVAIACDCGWDAKRSSAVQPAAARRAALGVHSIKGNSPVQDML